MNSTNTITATPVDCPECKNKGCGFCKHTGTIWFLPSPDAWDCIEIARAKWRIKNRNE